MAKQTEQQNIHINNMIKVGKPRTSKCFRKKGNTAARTVKSGSGRRTR